MNKKSKLFITVSSITLLLASCKGLPRFKPTTEPPTSGGDSDTSSVVSSGAVSSSGAVTSATSGEDSTSVTSVTGVTSGTAVTSGTPTSATTASTGTSSTKPSSSSTGTSATSHTSTGTSATSQPTSSSTGTSTPTSSGTSATSATSSSSTDPSDYYASISNSLSGTDLLNALHSLNVSKMKDTVGYAGMRQFSAKSDIDPDGSGKIIGFYDNAKIGPAWDSGATWNREHVWPNARGGSSVEGDAHMVRPASTSTNSGRGSKGFGTTSFDPGNDIAYYRGVAARIIFYCVVANTSLKLSENPFPNDYKNGTDPANTMGCLSDMLTWNLQYQPTGSFTGANDLARRVELQRNDVIQNDVDGQGNRNPFIDHPEYACRIWGNTDSTTRSVCGM